MRLHRIRLKNFGGVIDSGEVEFASTGVTVVEGPNEVGKTSMPEALDLIIGMPNTSATKKIKSVKPVGRDVGPEVKIEMSSGSYRFVYAKRWLRDSFATLKVITPEREQLSGREAHDRVKEILDETLDADLWAALRIDQGKELWLPSFADTSLGQALDSADGAQFTSEREDYLWDRIQGERDRYWTSTGRPSKERKSSEEQVEESQQQVAQIKQELSQIAKDSEEMARLETDTQRLESAQRDCEQQASELSEQWDTTERLRVRIQELGAKSEAAEARLTAINNEHQRRQSMIEEQAASAERLKALEVEDERTEPALAAASKRSKEADRAVDKAREALENAETNQRRANEDRDHHRRQIEVEQLQERHERIVEAKKTLSDAAARLETAKVDEDLLARITRANLEFVEAEAAFNSGAASVEMTAMRELALQIDGEEVTLLAGEARQSVVDVETSWTIPNVAVMRMKPGRESKDLAAKRRDALETLRGLCEAGGVADVFEAQKVARERDEAERRRDEAIKAIDRDLRDLTVEDIQTKIAGLSKRIASYNAERHNDVSLPTDFETAKQIALETEDALGECRNHLEACQRTADQANEAFSAERLKAAELDGQIKNAQSECKNAEERLAAARQERADADIDADLAQATQVAHTAKESLDAAETELQATDPDSLKARLDNARKALERSETDLRSNQDRQKELRGRLEIQGEKGLHSQLEEKQRELSHLERAHESTEARARAAALLYETFDNFRMEASQRYMAPFKERIEQLGRIVFGQSFEVELDENLGVAGRTLDGDTLTVDQLSTGTQEQIGVLCRLACAAIVSPDGGGAPVIIDDALGWSDPERLDRMGAAISSSSGECQVIILTCTPGRYAKIGNATTVQLPASQ